MSQEAARPVPARSDDRRFDGRVVPRRQWNTNKGLGNFSCWQNNRQAMLKPEKTGTPGGGATLQTTPLSSRRRFGVSRAAGNIPTPQWKLLMQAKDRNTKPDGTPPSKKSRLEHFNADKR